MPDLVILSERTLDRIPSGSGIVVAGNRAYIIGDDATSIFELDLNTYQHHSFPIPGRDTALYREPKPTKHDFESATLVDWKGHTYLMAIGSGSKAVTRDSMLLIHTADYHDCRLFSLQAFYDQLRKQTKAAPESRNIEGATVAGSKLILANRGDNSLMMLEATAFLDWLQNPSLPFPRVEIHLPKLPAIEGRQARLSGLCTLSSDELLFCASVEDTPDWISDGPILGSFIGSYRLSQMAVTAAYLLHDKQGNPLKEKIESLDMLREHSGDDVEILAIADHDDGSSKIFRLRFPLPAKD